MTFKMPEAVAYEVTNAKLRYWTVAKDMHIAFGIAKDHLAAGYPETIVRQLVPADQVRAAYEQGLEDMADFAIEAALCELDGSGQARAIEKAIKDHLKDTTT